MHTQLQDSAIHNLMQLNEVVSHTTSIQYTMPLTILSGSTIGMHIRHIIEFYQCLLNEYQRQEINYDARARNLEIETDPTYCQQIISSITQEINNIDENTSLHLFSNQSIDGPGHLLPSNLFRELTYVIEHAIHHMAIIKIAYTHYFPEIHLPMHFGIAFSTIKHQQLVHGNLSAS